MSETTARRYSWRHGWVPLTMRAALQKAKGNRELARQLLDEARAGRARRRAERGTVVFATPHPAHQAARFPAEGSSSSGPDRKSSGGRPLSARTDDELAEALGSADDDVVDQVLAELERRDARARRAEKARERRAQRRTDDEARRSAEFDAACDGGEDPEAAYARVYGVSEERQRRDQATAQLRESSYTGRTFRDLVKHAHADHVDLSYQHAERTCRGHVLNAAGERAGIDPKSLWSGPAARARKYGSPELLDYFRDHGRMTVEDFTAGLLGGHARFRTTGDDWL